MLLADVIIRGTRASQPAATTVAVGTLYGVTDEGNILERSNGTTWQAYSPSVGTGTVTATGTLTDHGVIVGNGGVDVSALAVGTTGQVLTGVTGADPAFAVAGFTKIEEQTPSGTGTLTFSSLGSFTHLEIRYSARSTQAAVSAEDLKIRFNADTGANYDIELLYNNGATTAASFESFAATSGTIGMLPAATATANRGAGGTIRILDYRGTTFNKVATADVSLAQGTATTSLVMRVFGVTWRNTAAITSVTLLLGAGNYVAGSKFTLYGLS